jgi:hypothetical protein
VLAAYLDRYPTGVFAGLARAKIKAAAEKQRIAALPPAVPPPPTTAAKEEAVWDLIKTSSDPAIFEMFLEKYPNGVNAEAARFKIATLSRVKTKTQAAAPVPAAPAPAPAQPAKSVAKPGESEDALWERIRGSDDPEALRGYLAQYPDGTYSGIAVLRLDYLQPKTQIAAAPAAAALSGGVDGIWHGTYTCGMSARAGAAAFNSTSRVFAVKQGKLTGKFEGNGFVEEVFGTVEPGGKVNISGTGTSTRTGGGYSMSFQGKEDGGVFTAKGRQYDRDCTLYYRKVQ